LSPKRKIIKQQEKIQEIIIKGDKFKMNLKKALRIFLISIVFIAILCILFIHIKNSIDSTTPVFAKEIFNINHIPRYKKLIGQEYETQIDLVVLNKKNDRNFFLLSAPGGMSLPSLNEIKKMKKFPYDYDIFSRIFGILPKRSKIKIINAIKTRITKMGQSHDSFPFLQGEIISEGKFQGYKVLLHNLTNLIYYNPDGTVDTLTILKKFAVKINSKEKDKVE
jgi:hypothetical protein